MVIHHVITVMLRALAYFQVEKVQKFLVGKGKNFSFHKTYLSKISLVIDSKLFADNQHTEGTQTITTRGPAHTKEQAASLSFQQWHLII